LLRVLGVLVLDEDPFFLPTNFFGELFFQALGEFSIAVSEERRLKKVRLDKNPSFLMQAVFFCVLQFPPPRVFPF